MGIFCGYVSSAIVELLVLLIKTRFNNNKGLMGSSCSQFGVANNSPDETGKIYDAIQAAATATKVDHRFILAVVLQESGGCVRAPTTNYGVRNPGIMQGRHYYLLAKIRKS